MTKFAVVLVLAELLVGSNSFLVSNVDSRFRLQSCFEKIREPISVDPNFEAHLPDLLKVGSAEDRPTPDIAADLRKRFKAIEGEHRIFIITPDIRPPLTSSIDLIGGSRKAAKVLQSSNSELAIELEELADELEETHEKFGKSVSWP